ncbi:MAG: hypothetical protein AB7X49_00410 [Geminicoccaceae bacterium]
MAVGPATGDHQLTRNHVDPIDYEFGASRFQSYFVAYVKQHWFTAAFVQAGVSLPVQVRDI